MKKVLLLSCFISVAAQAGTGGGTSTPPARAGVAKLLALVIGLESGELLVSDPDDVRTIGRAAVVELTDENGATQSFRVTDGDDANTLILKDRRELARKSAP